jgi:thiosulfate reductase cytochrome b subunit
VGIFALALTGLVIHRPDLFGVIPFTLAIHIHNGLGFILLFNAFLGLFFYVTTGTIRQYLPEPHDFISLGTAQLMYYVKGIFRGAPHPLEKTSERRLNPLQQVTYLVILNVLIPLQLISGLLMWGAQMQPDLLKSVGGLAVLSLIHTLGAWAFVAFIVVHVYLTTTGATPLSNIKAMITGYETLPAKSHAAEVERLARREEKTE